MGDQTPSGEPDRGRITSGLVRDALIERTLEFVRDELPKWRDDPARPSEESEERLNAQLCKYLNAASRLRFPMVCFHHEEKQTGTRRVDFSGLPSESQFIGTTFHSIYEPFIVFEGKRLPSPTRDREREYVTGGELKSGGIQRFKLGLHGAKQDLAVLIGYIQQGGLREWFDRVNRWIRDLETLSKSSGEKWSTKEQLDGFVEDASKNIADSRSLHPRVGDVRSSNVQLRHLWVRVIAH
jgi:hypothetical protein